MYNEPIVITDVKIDIGGTLGKVSRAEVTIKGGGKAKLEIVSDTITQLGNRVELKIRAGGWSFPANTEANTVKYTGRIYDFTFNFNEAKGRFSTTIKMVGLAEALSNINAFPEFSPKKTPYPSGWPKEFTPRDGDNDPSPVNNLLILLDALWEQEFPSDRATTGTKPIPGVPDVPGMYPNLYAGVRPPDLITDAFLGSYGASQLRTGTQIKYYINLEGLRALLMKVLETAANQADNIIANQLDITYATTEPNGDLVTKGSMASYLNSSNPEQILLFNNPVGSRTVVSSAGANNTSTTSTSNFYAQPGNKTARYAPSRFNIIT